jgi:Pentapeptide repeats (8 copies)
VLVAIALLGVLWEIPRIQARRFRGEATDKERFDIENEARKTLVQLVSGLAIVATIAITLYQTNETRRAADRNLELAARTQIAQRFAQALDLLGASDSGKKKLAPRIGGIDALTQMALNGDEDPNAVADILSAYIRREAPARGEGGFPQATSGAFSSCAENNVFYRRPGDVQAALYGLSSLVEHFQGVPVDLSFTDLTGFPLRSVHLASANLRDAVLVDADLQDADLHGATLVEANFQGACLVRANLSGSNAFNATFDKAHLRGATFRSACLREAYLPARGVSGQQLTEACTDPFDSPVALRTMKRWCRAIPCS